jgi:hypothetical protein
MSLGQAVLDLIKKAATVIEAKAAKVEPIAVECDKKLATLVHERCKAAAKEEAAKEDKKKLDEQIESEALEIFAKEVVGKVEFPSSIRLLAGKDSLLFTVTDRYGAVTKGRRQLLVGTSMEKFIGSKFEFKFDSCEQELKEKIVTLLLNNLTDDEQKEVFSFKEEIRKGSLPEMIQESKKAKDVIHGVTILGVVTKFE